MAKICPFLWFEDRADEAMKFYLSVFKNSRALGSQRFEIEGQELIVFNGGPFHQFNSAISLFVSCETQEEVDELWGKLLEGGEPLQCGWLKDKFGISWQIIPKTLMELLGDPDPLKARKVREAMLQMVKIDIQGLKDAYDS